MATEILRPNAAGNDTYIQYQNPTSTYHWDKVDEEVADGIATCVYIESSVEKRDLYNLPVSSGDGIINSIKIYIKCVCSGSATEGKVRASLRSKGITTDGLAQDIEWADGWKVFSETWATNPADATAWEWADIDTLQIGVALRGTAGTNLLRCTHVYVEISYTPDPNVTVIAPLISESTTFFSPTIIVGISTTITGVCIQSSATAYAPTITVSENTTITVPFISGVATVQLPTIITQTSVTVNAPLITAMSSVEAPTIVIGQGIIISAIVAQAIASVSVPEITTGEGIIVSAVLLSLQGVVSVYAPIVVVELDRRLQMRVGYRKAFQTHVSASKAFNLRM